MTDLFLVRHGQTVWHIENRYCGSSDIDLDEQGVAQAGQLARWAKSANLDAVWASDLGRARTTAQPRADAAGVDLRVDARLRELHFGQAEGLTIPEMAERFPDALAAFRHDPATHPLPRGESPHAAAQRFVAALVDIDAEFPDGRVLVVAHSTTIRLALCTLLGLRLGRYRDVFPAVTNCAITEIRFRDGHFGLMRYNSPIT
ncbi:MAG TPA: histidine phosphatase family protein [Nakamurella sp.]